MSDFLVGLAGGLAIFGGGLYLAARLRHDHARRDDRAWDRQRATMFEAHEKRTRAALTPKDTDNG